MKYALVMLFLATQVSAATIFVSAPASTQTGGLADPTIEIVDGVNVGVVTVTLTYDPTVLRVERCDATGTEFSASQCDIAFAPNQVRFVASSPTALSGDFLELGFIEFAAIGADGTHSPLTLTVQRYTDPHGHPLAVSTSDADIAIRNPATPTPTPTTPPSSITLLVENPDIVPLGLAVVPIDVWDPGGFGSAADVASLVATVHYDTTLVSASACTIGHDLSLCFNPETHNRIPNLCFDTGFCDVGVPGQVTFSAGADNPLVNARFGTGLGSITFVSTTNDATGSTPLTLSNLEAFDFSGQAITVIPQNGSLTFELPSCCGDEDNNGAISTAEATRAILALINRDPASDPAAQCTSPGQITTADVTKVILNLVNRSC